MAPKTMKLHRRPEAEFKEYVWFHLKLYNIFQALSRRSIETDFWGI